MKTTRAASRYAKALLELATELNQKDQVYADVQDALKSINDSRELRVFLMSPVVKYKQKQAVLRKIFSASVSELTLHFILLITQHGREASLPQIFESFILQYKASKNILDATIKVSTDVSAASLAGITAKLEAKLGKTIDLTTEIDENLIGGYVIEMDNYRLDASIAGGLNKLKRELITKR
jgi:F-type H+-transporting ATPase subunit delta